MQALETIVIEAKQAANCVIIWLPGLEQSGHHMKHLADDLTVADFIQVKHVFVHPPKGDFLPRNKKVRRWLDFEMVDGKISFKKDTVDESVILVNNIINAEIELGISPEHVYVAGFSQGSIIGYLSSIALKRKMGGLIIMSGISTSRFGFRDPTSKQTDFPVLLCHGTQDKTFPFEQSKTSVEDLKMKGFQVDFLEYEMGHEICDQQVNDIAQWIENHYSEKSQLAS